MKTLAALVLLGMATPLFSESHEFEVGIENFLYETGPSLLNLGNVLGLRGDEDLLRAAIHGKETFGEGRVVLSGYVQTRPGTSNAATWTAREAYVQYGFGPGVSVRLGKQRVDWGSGFAWNPSNRVEPPRNPLNTALEEEGALAARIDIIPASWVGIILLAAKSNTRPEDLPFAISGPSAKTGAIRARFLVRNTDLALVLSGGTNTHRVLGLDVGRTIGSLAVHAEAALSQGSDLPPSRSGTTFVRMATGFLETQGSTSYSLEYFLNGDGWTQRAYDAYRTNLQDAFAQAMNPALPTGLKESSFNGYLALAALPYAGGLGLRRHYVHGAWNRGEIKGRIGLSAQAVWGVSDSGLTLTPGASYVVRDQLTFNVDAVWLLGKSTSEYRLAPIRGALQGRIRFLF